MKPRVIVQVDSTAEQEREVIQNYVEECMPKVDAYLRKYDDTNDATNDTCDGCAADGCAKTDTINKQTKKNNENKH